MNLNEYWKGVKRVALAFSGGTDSAYLLSEAMKSGCEVHPYFVKTAFQPQFELDDAMQLANELGVELTIIEKDILQVPEVAVNPENRCYYCKQAIFQSIAEAALADGCQFVMDGTNASDDADSRPGMKALAEMGVRSPLRECGLTKQEIRRKSREAGLFTWDKPAYACLATRIPAGTSIEPDVLKRIEQAEQVLSDAGFVDFRIRVFQGAAILQMTEQQWNRVCLHRGSLFQSISPYFNRVLLDLNPREESVEV